MEIDFARWRGRDEVEDRMGQMKGVRRVEGTPLRHLTLQVGALHECLEPLLIEILLKFALPPVRRLHAQHDLIPKFKHDEETGIIVGVLLYFLY